MDFSRPEPNPPPVTIIAWRMCHIIGSDLALRSARYFGGPPFDADTFAYPGSASDALEMLDQGYAVWKAGVAGLDEAALSGTARERFGQVTMAALILHIQRKVIHHSAEIALLRDLFRATQRGRVPLTPSA